MFEKVLFVRREFCRLTLRCFRRSRMTSTLIDPLVSLDVPNVLARDGNLSGDRAIREGIAKRRKLHAAA